MKAEIVEGQAKPTLIAMMGLPRSGKSTIVQSLMRALPQAAIVRRDAIRLAVHGERYLGPVEPFIKVLDLYMIKSLFLAGHPFVICDETNYSKAARDHMRDESWETVWYPVLTDPQTCMDRAIATNQEDLLPVIAQMWARYEPLGQNDEVYVDYTHNGTLVTTKFKA